MHALNFGAILLLLSCILFSQLPAVTGSGICANPTTTIVEVSSPDELKNGITCANENTWRVYILVFRADITLTSAWGGSSSNGQSVSGLWLGPNAKVFFDGARAGGGTWKLTRLLSAAEFRLIYVSEGAVFVVENLELRNGKRPTSGNILANYVSHSLPCLFSLLTSFPCPFGFVHHLYVKPSRTRALTLNARLCSSSPTSNSLFVAFFFLRQGGAVYVTGGTVNITACTLRENQGRDVSSAIIWEHLHCGGESFTDGHRRRRRAISYSPRALHCDRSSTR